MKISKYLNFSVIFNFYQVQILILVQVEKCYCTFNISQNLFNKNVFEWIGINN
jgi:hypothetical protein